MFRPARLLASLVLLLAAYAPGPVGPPPSPTQPPQGSGPQAGTTGTSGTTGGDDAGGTSFPDVSPAQAEALSQVLASLPALGDGGAADLDGDGVPDVYVTWDNAGVEVEQQVGASGYITLNSERSQDGSVTAWGDRNEDGQVDYDEVTTVQGEVVTSTRQFDSDFDGAFDRRETRVWDHTAGTLDFTLEVLHDNADGGEPYFAVEEQRSGPAQAFRGQAPVGAGDARQGSPGVGLSGSNGSGGLVPNFQVEPGPGWCDSAFDTPNNAHGGPQTIRTALASSLATLSQCLEHFDPGLAVDLGNVFARNRVVLTCDGLGHKLLGDIGDPSSRGRTYQLHLESDANSLTGQELLHELLHLAGRPHRGKNDDSDPANNPKDDQVYACERLCAGVGSARDCALCADDAHKGLCGEKTVVRDESYLEDPVPVNPAPCFDDATHPVMPLSVRVYREMWCDDSRRNKADEQLCISACPAGSHAGQGDALSCSNFGPDGNPYEHSTCAVPPASSWQAPFPSK